MITDCGKRPGFKPANWSGWILVTVLWVLGKFPVRLGIWCARPLGWLVFHLLKRRKLVAQRNIERCFPALGQDEVQKLLRANFRSLARTVFETAWCWGMGNRRFSTMASIDGLEHLEAAKASGRGVLLFTAHMTSLEIGGRVVGSAVPAAAVYRPLGNEVIEWYQNRGRLRYAEAMISKREMRSVIRYLRKGGVVWYAPDQDFGAQQSVFVPFFGIQTATLEATHKLISLTKCAVVPMFPEFVPEENRYRITIRPALEELPTGDVLADLSRLNAEMESHIRKVPEQYWWIHRRFKTRPEGEAPFYD